MKGKILVCDSVLAPATFASLNGAVGVVMNDAGVKDNARSYPLPSSYVGPVAGDSIKTYLDLNKYIFVNLRSQYIYIFKSLYIATCFYIDIALYHFFQLTDFQLQPFSRVMQ